MPTCEICGYESETEHGVASHKAVHSGSGSKKKEYECEECGKSFEDYPSRREGRGRENFFCSRDCKDEYETKEKFYFECTVCGDDVVRHPSTVDEVGGYDIDNHFCSKDCESVYKSEEWVKEGHPLWNGGNGIDYGPNWKQSRRDVLERDNRECKLCSMTREEHYAEYGRDLDVHHIKSIREFDGNYESANQSDNLITLCRQCHVTVEHNDVDVEELV